MQYTPDKDPHMQDVMPDTAHISGLAKTAVVSAIVTVMFGPILAMCIFGRSLTPDIVYRWTAEGQGGAYGLTGMALAATVALLPRIAGRQPDSLESAWGTTLGAMIFIWTIGTGIAAVDFEGSHNPYVRAKPAYAWQYAELASARRHPQVAAQIRQAASDGVVTAGEAYDILNGDTLRNAEDIESKAGLDRARADVLARSLALR